ncbi:Sec-independent protein translocase protein TatB [Aquabacter cavernae]|uniref:Sec-independent protein translocase protein TatB n=1 Tax=Aquabacter cavernae TaxID=2496029 RepID=UPI001FE14BCF|nr:Sec-independent protein translocase protein TatB [Aquabacter cavernae]
MFDIGWSELMLIGVVALVVIGPKELPGVLRTVGKTITKLRRMAGEFQGQFQDALREAELSEIRKEIGDIAGGAADTVKKNFAGMDVLDPLRSIREEIRSTVEGATATAAAPVAAPEAAAIPPASAAAASAAAAAIASELSGFAPAAQAAPVSAAPVMAEPLPAAPTTPVIAEPLVPEPLVPLPEPAAQLVLDPQPAPAQNAETKTSPESGSPV